jgi:secretory phospholipase A2
MLGAVVVVSAVILTCECTLERKHSLRIDTTFEDDDGVERNHTILRNQAAQERINLSFPGTKWCGPGNTASEYDDLGSAKDTDMCCREHDHCDNMAAGEEKNGLKNNDYFTRLHCQCDKEFKQCLQKVNSRRGNLIGNFYFNVRDRCYKEQHPIVSCDEMHTK